MNQGEDPKSPGLSCASPNPTDFCVAYCVNVGYPDLNVGQERNVNEPVSCTHGYMPAEVDGFAEAMTEELLRHGAQPLV